MPNPNEDFKFEPEKWDKLNRAERIKMYDEYMVWCGGLVFDRPMYYIEDIYGKRGPYHQTVDHFDIENLKDEDNLYKKLKGYICLQRRYIRMFGIPRAKFLTEEFFQENMNDFRKLLRENIDEIIRNLSGTKWLPSIMKCFFDCGTKKEKIQVVILTSLMQLSSVDFRRTRSQYTEDDMTTKYVQNFIEKYILPLENKSFENIVLSFLEDDNFNGIFKYKNDAIKMLKEIK
tara:strand:- start:1705 stop:2397 length:693 start_codon:yes stop_codon:yes gene_type:complete